MNLVYNIRRLLFIQTRRRSLNNGAPDPPAGIKQHAGPDTTVADLNPAAARPTSAYPPACPPVDRTFQLHLLAKSTLPLLMISSRYIPHCPQ